MNFNELQKLFSEKLDIVHLSDIARELSVSPQVINNWKKRDKIPYKYVKKIRRIEKVIGKRKGLDSDDLNIIKSLNKLSSSDSFVEEDVNVTKDIINFFLLFKNIFSIITDLSFYSPL